MVILGFHLEKMLEYLTGARLKVKKKSEWVSQSTYVQVQHAHYLGNFAAHNDDDPTNREEPSVQFIVTACLCGLTLLENLSLELPR